MRTKIMIAVAVMALAAITALVCLMPAKPHAGPWRLADGSELSLAGVTYGKNHTMRYGNGIADYLYRVLTPALRKKFGCKVATVTTFSTNDIVIWIWHKGLPPTNGNAMFMPPSDHISVVDENGIESAVTSFPSSRVLWQKTNVLEGVQLGAFPRRSREIGIRIRRVNEFRLLAEFKIPNPGSTNYPVWTARPLPVTVKTNDLEVSLVKFETGLIQRGIKSGTRAVFKITKNQKACDDWIMRNISASSGAGEFYGAEYWSTSTYGSGGEAVSTGRIPLWPEEPGWKVTAEFWRMTNYPATELWTVKGVTMPGRGVTREMNLATNIYDTEIELMGITGGKLTTNNSAPTKPSRGPAILQITSPIPSLDKHLRLAEVIDDRGRKVDFHLDQEMPSTGGRGATVRQLDKDYYLYPEKDVKSVDVTLVYSKSVSVEFLARPTVAHVDQSK